MLLNQDTVREERDKLVSEKASAPVAASEATAAVPGDVNQLRQQFEAEKAELIKARDDALARSKVCLLSFGRCLHV